MFKKAEKHIKISEFRKNLARYFKRAAHEPVIVGGREDSRVVLSAQLYNTLVSAWEDQRDAQELARLVANDTGERASWDEVKREHGV